MKKIKFFLLLAILTLISLPEISAQLLQDNQGQDQDRQHHTIGAPLDGGILAILVAAGAGYFIARKRKKNNI